MKNFNIVKRSLAVFVSMVMACSVTAISVTAAEPSQTQFPVAYAEQQGDFQIENGVLVKYTGAGGEVIIPDTVTSIGDYAFSHCKELTSVIIPETVTRIGNAAFYYCTNLTNIVLPDNITELGKFAFGMCYGLSNITIPKGVTTVHNWTFACCENLQSVVILPNVTKISDFAFDGCTKLTTVYGISGTYPETFANENKYQFIDINEPFTDVAYGDWFYDAVVFVYKQELMTGTTPTTFDPAVPMNRAQFATVLYRLAGEPEVEYTPNFPDVPDGWFYSDAITWATENGIITGYDDGNFGTQVNITSEQIVTLLYRYANYVGLDTSQRVSLDEYVDGSTVSDFAKDAMEWALAVGIIQGQNNQGIIDPQGEAGRAAGATIFMRFMERYQM